MAAKHQPHRYVECTNVGHDRGHCDECAEPEDAPWHVEPAEHTHAHLPGETCTACAMAAMAGPLTAAAIEADKTVTEPGYTAAQGLKDIMEMLRYRSGIPAVVWREARRIEDLVNGIDPNPREAAEYEAERAVLFGAPAEPKSNAAIRMAEQIIGARSQSLVDRYGTPLDNLRHDYRQGFIDGFRTARELGL